MSFLWIGLILLGIAVDRFTKYLVINKMMLGESVSVLPGLLRWTYVQNRGAAFGILSDHRWVFLAFTTVALLLGIIFYFSKYSKDRFLCVIVAMMIAGGVGNMIDRIAWGYVVDFISVSFFPPVFNFADILITISAALLIFYVVLSEYRDWRRKKDTLRTEKEKQEKQLGD